MPRHETVPIPAKTWYQVTISNATKISFQNQSSGRSFITPTVGEVTPTSKTGSTIVDTGVGGNGTFAELWPGITGANRLYVWRDTPGLMLISHD